MTNEEMVKAVDEIGKRLYALNIDLNEMEKNLDVCCEMIAEVYANIRESRWTEQDIKDARTILRLWPDAKYICRMSDGDIKIWADDGEFTYLDSHLFPELVGNEEIELDEIIGGAE